MKTLVILGLLLGCSQLATAAPTWEVKETLVAEDLFASTFTRDPLSSHSKLIGGVDPSLLVSLQLEGTASVDSRASTEELISLLPQGLGSLFTPVEAEEKSAGGHSLRDFEWSMCGGRFKPEWPSIDSVNMNATVIPSSIYRHQNHVTCSLSPVSSCYANDAAKRGSDTICEDKAVRKHHAQLLRHWGQFVGATNGIGGSVYDIHDHYHSAPKAVADSSSITDLWRSPYYRKSAEFDRQSADSTSLLDISSLTGGSTSGNRLISAHKRPLGVQSIKGNQGCFHDMSSMERLCTESLLPLLFVWDDLLQLNSTKVEGSEEPLLIKHRSRNDVWFRGYELNNKRSKQSRRMYKDPSAVPSIVEVAIPDAIFVLSTGYHSASVRVSLDDSGAKPTLKVHLEIAFVLSTPEEVSAWREYTTLRTAALGEVASRPQVTVTGNAIDVAVASLDSPKNEPIPSGPVCRVDASITQEGEVRGDLQVRIHCDGLEASQGAEIESLLLVPAHTINPLLSGMAYSATTDGVSVLVTKMQYDPLSTITAAVIRSTIPFINGTSASAKVSITVPFRFPSLRLDHYPPDMNKAYLLPQVVSRVRFQGGSALGHSSTALLHQKAIEAIMGGEAGGGWSYQRCSTVTSVTLPLPDPGMVFNVLSLSSALLALLIGRGIGSVMRRRF